MIYLSSLQIKVLLLAVKDFDPDCGDSAYTVGIVDLLLKCVELSYRAGNFLISYSDSYQKYIYIYISKRMEYNLSEYISLLLVNF